MAGEHSGGAAQSSRDKAGALQGVRGITGSIVPKARVLQGALVAFCELLVLKMKEFLNRLRTEQHGTMLEF